MWVHLAPQHVEVKAKEEKNGTPVVLPVQQMPELCLRSILLFSLTSKSTVQHSPIQKQDPEKL